jgi:hypothetical protein
MKKTTQSETQKGIKNLEKSINNLYDKMESRFRNEIEHSITMEEIYEERFEAIEKSLEEIKELLKKKD